MSDGSGTRPCSYRPRRRQGPGKSLARPLVFKAVTRCQRESRSAFLIDVRQVPVSFSKRIAFYDIEVTFALVGAEGVKRQNGSAA